VPEQHTITKAGRQKVFFRGWEDSQLIQWPQQRQSVLTFRSRLIVLLGG
jgi:hypothetical protein